MTATDRFFASGKIPTTSEFWEMGADKMIDRFGITEEFTQVLGEQLFAPLVTPETAFYSAFAGRPMNEGQAWMERLIKIKPPKKFNAKATAQDDLGFYDSEGMEKVFHLSYEGWRPLTQPSDLVSARMFNTAGGVAEFNSILFDAMVNDYQEEMNDSVMLKAVATTTNEVLTNVNDTTVLRDTIRRVAGEMRGRDNSYNNVNANINRDYRLGSRDGILAFMDVNLYNKLVSDEAELPSPDRIIQNTTIIPVMDGLPRPPNMTEYTAGQTSNQWSTPASNLAIGKTAPKVLLMSRRRMEVRPYRGSYRVALSNNGAGGFTNIHMNYAGAIGVRPWENAVAIRQS
jgi:hypothetical protein